MRCTAEKVVIDKEERGGKLLEEMLAIFVLLVFSSPACLYKRSGLGVLIFYFFLDFFKIGERGRGLGSALHSVIDRYRPIVLDSRFVFK